MIDGLFRLRRVIVPCRSSLALSAEGSVSVCIPRRQGHAQSHVEGSPHGPGPPRRYRTRLDNYLPLSVKRGSLVPGVLWLIQSQNSLTLRTREFFTAAKEIV